MPLLGPSPVDFFIILFAPVASNSLPIYCIVFIFSSDVFSSNVLAGCAVLFILVKSIGILYGSSKAELPAPIPIPPAPEDGPKSPPAPPN